ncbi:MULTISPECIES: NifU family protein [Weeksella]|uniref:Nitrogen-fixing NifU domain-containing protein n=1 Tax=Weeksella virosa (strain ATCC 43766 / DSM 16922 / JCM 21250 / CCUG 30538 / CDC 9751 / IAM 14551 / NBRC 16016 / NCTC 11634 / CL345/78) TaxID=865938 RepID=F0P2K3_WEEVC|nr:MULTISPECIES: NifU family protein [Weeksella]ADX67842.1 nitrogen-fixing NifU domain-containing protein [Weeksella virosa DSM 16922]MDK7374131.1 NifU family protein [Weeksella virosa]MDK7674443.1 NifU family protein [Weeksella virosa]OFM82809.1 hypothetical protein HMPREF2660_03940 [Weeksella sp. HMSC059D05]SUP54145.1 Fe/S biogenesis protein NfuA [Weeksella virosa]
MNTELIDNVHKALDEIRPFLNSDGGDIELVEVKDNVVKVRLKGACTSCSVNQMTLKAGVETTVKKFVPEIIKVIDVSSQENAGEDESHSTEHS